MGGVRFRIEEFGGGLLREPRIWGGQAPPSEKMGGVTILWPKAGNLAPPPPEDVFGTFP